MLKKKLKYFLNINKKQSELPSGYTKCEYLEGTGTQYIDTGFKGTIDGFTVYVDAQSTVSSSESKVLIGANGSADASSWFGSSTVWTGGGTAISNVNCTTRIKVETHFGTELQYELNGVNYKRIGNVAMTEKTTTLFRGISSAGNQYYFIGKLYEAKIYNENNILVRDLIPCLDNNKEPCMYDKVTKQTFYNQGTGNFIYKIENQLPSNYTKCEYLEGTGTQYIDTNKKQTELSKIELEFALTSTTQINKVLFGVYDSNPDIRRFQMAKSNIDSLTMGLGDGYTRIYDLDTEKHIGILDTKNIKVYYDGDEMVENIGTYSNKITSSNLCLFNRETDGTTTISNCILARIYSYKYYDNDILIQYLIPCLDKNGEPCMYDVINNKTFYNKGTGTFKYQVEKNN